MDKQITHNIIMIRPIQFGYNEETAKNNSFQIDDGTLSPKDIATKARLEFDQFVDELRSKGINVDVYEDLIDPVTPDAIFPNNWFTMHSNGLVISYPMFAPTRRNERRPDIIASLHNKFKVKKDYTFEHYEDQNLFLEGTGSLILDRVNRIAYAAISPRTDISLLDKWCILMDYKKVHFTAVDRKGEEIYHTNVMMALGEDFAVICLDSISDENERKHVINTLQKTGKEIIEIDYEQMESFAGNMLQVQSTSGEKYLIMSSTAMASLTDDQILKIERLSQVIIGQVPTIEKYGGGSVRCMIAENFLPVKKG